MIWGIDIGGTNIKMGLFSNGKLISDHSISTKKINNGENILKEISDFIIKHHQQNNIPLTNLKGIGFGVPGPVKNNFIIRCPNLGWESKYLVPEFKEIFQVNLPIFVGNDADLAAYGEYNQLNIKENILFVTLGTGVGGGLIIEDKILEGSNGAAGEIGHIKVDYDNPQKCSCGLVGCLETVCSISGLSYLGQKLYDKKIFKTALREFELKPIEVFKAAKKGDELGLEIIKLYSSYLAQGIANIAITVDPNVVIIGGGISNAGEILLNNVIEKYQEVAHYGIKDVKFSLAKLGNKAGMYGAYYLVKNNE